MASIVSKFARAAGFATRASPSAVGGFAGAGRPAAAATRVSPAGGPKSESSSSEEEKARPKSELEVAPHATVIRRKPQLPVDENALKSKEAMWAFYEYWCKFHGVSRDRAEMVRRFRTFSATARSVHKANNSQRNVTYSMNKFSDMTRIPGGGYRRRTQK